MEGERKGPAADFQAALDAARGEIVTPLSDDDHLPPHALETAAATLGDHAWLVGATVGVRDGQPTFLRGGRTQYVQQTRDGQYMLGGAVYWRRRLTDELGGFDSAFDGAADFDLYLRFLEREEPALTNDILYVYNDHDGSDSRAQATRQAEATRRISDRARSRPAARAA